MASLPRNKQVVRAILSLVKEVKLATKEANELAARRLGHGDYVGAQSLIDVAKAVSTFGGEVKALRSRWKGLRSVGHAPKHTKSEQTPLWEFYRPILQAIASLGGEASRKQIEAKLEETIQSSLKPGDQITNVKGIPRWKIMVGRARKPMIAEGFVCVENLLRWKITSKGEQAAKTGIKGK